ncbi:uncharacterized protein LOC115447278 isoform X1 [Manduca sexta]|uniref:uncharacterized protein LOC115447278 isoform X1 n=1 Tax=Manduca sexta TaxID=7130 RepID=UPI00188E69B8|nr:uncharacterized protein LOC115447278 isoform X1 [Manduca sexta]
MTVNKIMVTAGICTLLQAVGQMIFSALAVAQHFCVVDFLREIPLLLYVRILYFHNPDNCGVRINIGQSIDGIANQAFVLLTEEPLTAFRTFIINSISLGLSVLWIITSAIVMMGGAKNNPSRYLRWPWITVTVAVCALDLIATVTYCNDSFYTRTLSDIMEYIGGTASGIAGVNLNTSWASWLMVILYSRFIVLFLLNLFFIVLMIVDNGAKKESDNVARLETSTAVKPEPSVEVPAPVRTLITVPTQTSTDSTSDKDIEGSVPSETSVTRIPRPGISQSFRRMKTLLFKRLVRSHSHPDSLEASERFPRVPQAEQAEQADIDKKRGVNFPENLLSLPQRLENMIAEQQRRLDKAIIDTAGRQSPPRASQSMPQLATSSSHPDLSKGRRGTTVELQGQLPWAYIPASAHRMRDQLPPDEDLPPVPLPDYSAIPSFRKASVHRAASSLSSLTQKKDYALSPNSRQSMGPVKPAKFKAGSNLQLLPIFIESN